MDLQFDVLIVGAGPAGCSCALHLANQGLRVAIADKATFPRDKICGDGLSGHAVSELKKLPGSIFNNFLNLPDVNPSHGFRIVSPSSYQLDLPYFLTSNPAHAPGFTCKRKTFDDFLVKKLSNHPDITLFENTTIKSLTVLPDKIVAKSTNLIINSQVVVGADGYQSIVKKHLHPHSKNSTAFALRGYFQGVTGFHSQQFIEMHFLKELPSGYLWIFPESNNLANVGIGFMRSKKGFHKDLKHIFNNIITESQTIAPRFAQASMVGNLQGYFLPLYTKKTPVSGERMLLTGDAAGLVNPFTGEGIGNALLSGRLAANQILQCFQLHDFSKNQMVNYDKIIKAKLWKESRISLFLSRLTGFSWLFDAVFKKAVHRQDIQHLIVTLSDDLSKRNKIKTVFRFLKLLLKKQSI